MKGRSEYLVIMVLLAITLAAACVAPAPPEITKAPVSVTPSARALTPAQTATVRPSSEIKTTPAAAPEKPYFQDKTITIQVASSAGGGTDAVARINAILLPKYIPGTPKVVVQNKGGGGGTMAMNSLYLKTKPDGLTLLEAGSQLLAMQMRGVEGVNYDLTKTRFIGSVTLSGAVMIVNRKALPNLADYKARPLAMGARSAEEPALAMPLWGQQFLGWNIKWILGFGGGGEIDLAFRRGEIDIQTTYNTVILRPLIQEGLAVPVTQFGVYRGGKFVRRSDFSEVPTFVELLGDKKPTGTAWQAYMAWIGPNMVDKLLLVPPGTPEDIYNILVDAYARMTKDPKFDEMVRKMMGEPYDVGIGKDTENVVTEVLSTSPEALEYGVNLQRKFGLISR